MLWIQDLGGNEETHETLLSRRVRITIFIRIVDIPYMSVPSHY
jgi:hypothetical protein